MTKRNKAALKGDEKRLQRLEKDARRVLIVGFFVVIVIGGGYSFFLTQHYSQVRQVLAYAACMLDDWTSDSALFAAEVAGETYYCCFEKCGETLQQKPDLRFSIDPISGMRIDKAHAYYGVSRQGRIYYFETPENLEKFHTEP